MKKLLLKPITWIIIICVVALIATGILWRLYQKQKETTFRWQGDYVEMTREVDTLRDAKGKLQSRVRKLIMTKTELRSDLFAKDERIQKIKDELQASNVKINRLESVLLAELHSKNEGTDTIRDTVYIEQEDTINKRILQVQDSNLTFEATWQAGKVVPVAIWGYSYNESLLYWGEMIRRMYNDKGNKRFFLWKWICPDWEAEFHIKSLNKNSEIDAIQIDVQN
jgi:hypothetical protein